MWNYKKYRRGVIVGNYNIGKPIPDEYCIRLRWLLTGFLRWLGIQLFYYRNLHNAYKREVEKNIALTEKLEQYEKSSEKKS